VAGKLAFQSDREADILHISIRPPDAEQEREELGDDVIALLNPKTCDVESLEGVVFLHSAAARRPVRAARDGAFPQGRVGSARSLSPPPLL
jgi:uncharacterized protein YuzE